MLSLLGMLTGRVVCVLFLGLVLVVCGEARGGRSIAEPAPSNGTQRLLVLTVEYPNQKGLYTGLQWKNGLFADFNTFYKAQSYNTIQFEIDVVTVNDDGDPVINDPVANSYIPLRFNTSMYANGEYGWKFDTDWSLDTIARHTAEYLDSNKFNWTAYNQSGKVQNVIIMSAGTDYRYAQETYSNAANNYLLSTSFSGANYRTRTGVYFSSYTFCSEHTQSLDSQPRVMAHLGQCAHEYGHALGMPDLYDISVQSSGVGYFDLLGYGVYANNNPEGNTPVGFGAYPKTALGWAHPIEIRNSTEVLLGPSSVAAGNFLRIFPNTSSDIYYLVENRQPTDTWDKNFVEQYTSGILIWRVNGDDAKKYTLYNHVNTYCKPLLSYCPTSSSIVVEEADGEQDMSTPGPSMKYGSAADVWQVGQQFIGVENVTIALMDFNDGVYSIFVSFEGPVMIPDHLHNIGHMQHYPLLLLLTAILLVFLI